MGKGEEELQNLLIEYTNLLKSVSYVVEILQFKNKVHSLIFVIAANLAILYVNWVEVFIGVAILGWNIMHRNTPKNATGESIKSDKDIGQSVIYLQKINIGLRQFRLGGYSYKFTSVVVAIAAVLRVVLSRRCFYALTFTSAIVANSAEMFIIIDSLKSDYSLKDKRIGFAAFVKDKINTLKRNKSKCKDTMFRFEIYENQRWWMGLDWTHALLPGERPTWCVLLVCKKPLNSQLTQVRRHFESGVTTQYIQFTPGYIDK